MKISYFSKVFLIFSLIAATGSSLHSQVVWPGDVNNNGVVNVTDWIYLSQLVGEFGPPRLPDQMGLEWEAKTINTLWGIDIPGTSVDYAYADCNGDGFIDIEDLKGIDFNFGEEHGVVEVDVAMTGVLGNDPELFFAGFSGDLFPQGGLFLLELYLGTVETPVTDFNGISFTLNFDPDLVSEIFFMPPEESDDGWSEHGLFPYERSLDSEGKLEFAFAPQPMDVIENESGLLGRFFIVIEDDVVDWQNQEIETEIKLDNVILFSEGLNIAPVVGDTIDVTIVADPLSNENLINQGAVEVFPNPTFDYVYLDTDQKIEGIEVYDAIGKRLQSFEAINSDPQKIDLSDNNTGIYFLKIRTEKGVLTKKIFLY